MALVGILDGNKVVEILDACHVDFRAVVIDPFSTYSVEVVVPFDRLDHIVCDGKYFGKPKQDVRDHPVVKQTAPDQQTEGEAKKSDEQNFATPIVSQGD